MSGGECPGDGPLGKEGEEEIGEEEGWNRETEKKKVEDYSREMLMTASYNKM